MTCKSVLSVLFLISALVACSGPGAFVDYPLSAATQSKPVWDARSRIFAVGICYNATVAAPGDIVELARQECAKIDRRPKFAGQDMLACPLFVPVRATYHCVKAPAAP